MVQHSSNAPAHDTSTPTWSAALKQHTPWMSAAEDLPAYCCGIVLYHNFSTILSSQLQCLRYSMTDIRYLSFTSSANCSHIYILVSFRSPGVLVFISRFDQCV